MLCNGSILPLYLKVEMGRAVLLGGPDSETRAVAAPNYPLRRRSDREIAKVTQSRDRKVFKANTSGNLSGGIEETAMERRQETSGALGSG